MKMRKYHGLGNDYLVISPDELTFDLSVENIQLICSQHYGAGSDGILTGPHTPDSADFKDNGGYVEEPLPLSKRSDGGSGLGDDLLRQ